VGVLLDTCYLRLHSEMDLTWGYGTENLISHVDIHT
jgi:hypothetical protein